MKKDENKARLPFFGIGKILPYLKNYKKALAVMLIGSLVGSIIDISVPLFQRYALNHFISGGTLDTLLVFIILYLLIIVSCAALNYASTYQGTAVEVGVDKDLRNDAFEHLQTLSFSYFNQNSVGYIHSRVMSDTSRIGTLVSWTLLDSIWQLSYLVGASAVMLSLNARLALLVLAVLPVTVLLFSFFQARLTKLNREIREQNSVITGAFNEGITGARTIKTLVIEELMGRSFTAETEAHERPFCLDHAFRVIACTCNRALEGWHYREDADRYLLSVHVLCTGDDGACQMGGGRHFRSHNHSG